MKYVMKYQVRQEQEDLKLRHRDTPLLFRSTFQRRFHFQRFDENILANPRYSRRYPLPKTQRHRDEYKSPFHVATACARRIREEPRVNFRAQFYRG